MNELVTNLLGQEVEVVSGDYEGQIGTVVAVRVLTNDLKITVCLPKARRFYEFWLTGNIRPVVKQG